MRRRELIEIFEDTLARASVPATSVIADFENFEPKGSDLKATVVNADSLTPAQDGDLVLNFASGWTPGGGVKKGMSAQEENLCQRTSLYKSLISDSAKKFYELNHRIPNLSADCAIISDNVEVIKDKNFRLLSTPKTISVLTVAAPRLTDGMPCSYDRYKSILKSRIHTILMSCIAGGYRSVVLGAWGCGVYKNDPQLVARYFHEEINQYSGYFDKIIFAIPAPSRNHDVFSQEFAR